MTLLTEPCSDFTQLYAVVISVKVRRAKKWDKPINTRHRHWSLGYES